MCIRDRDVSALSETLKEKIARIEQMSQGRTGMTVNVAFNSVSYTHLDVYKRQPLPHLLKKMSNMSGSPASGIGSAKFLKRFVKSALHIKRRQSVCSETPLPS